MKAYKIQLHDFDELIVCAAPNASKAKAECVQGLLEVGYRNWKDALFLIKSCRREPSLDVWANQFSSVESWDYDRAVNQANKEGDRDSNS